MSVADIIAEVDRRASAVAGGNVLVLTDGRVIQRQADGRWREVNEW